MWWQIVVVVLAGLLPLWMDLVAALYLLSRRQGNPVGYTEVLRLVPDIIRLVRRLAADPTFPVGADQVGPPAGLPGPPS